MIKKATGYLGVGPFLRGDSFARIFDNDINFFVIMMSISMLTVFDAIQYKTNDLFAYISEQRRIYRWIIYIGLVLMIVLFGAYGEGYEQTNFIYFQF